MCQDTGLAVVFADLGQDAHIVGGDFEQAIHEGIRQGYVNGYLRKPVWRNRFLSVKTPETTRRPSSIRALCPETLCICVWLRREPARKTRAF